MISSVAQTEETFSRALHYHFSAQFVKLLNVKCDELSAFYFFGGVEASVASALTLGGMQHKLTNLRSLFYKLWHDCKYESNERRGKTGRH